jgi:hypothetical protein
MHYFKYLIGILSITAFWACEKTVYTDDLVFDLEPRIELKAVSQDTLVEFLDQLVIKIAYEDGDGDLGTSDPDVNSVFVKDSRLEKADEYYLPPLAPEDAEISIQGDFDLQLSTTFLLGNGSKEEMVLSIYVVDRAGNQSNTIETPPITLIRE